jgi:hypothetical protein
VFFSLIGIAPPAVMAIGLLGIDVGDWLGLDHAFDPVILGVAALALVASIALPLVCLKMRDPGPSRVVADGWGITEWDGDLVRTAIPWDRAGVFVLETRVHDRRMGRTYIGGVTVSVVSDLGWAVNVVWGRWKRQALRRRMLSATEFTASALGSVIPGAVRRLQNAVADPRDDRRPLFYFARVVGLLFMAATGAGIAQATADLGRNHQQEVGLLWLVAAILMVLRALRPLLENVRLSREAAPCRQAIPVTLAPGGEGPFARANDAQGRPLMLDLSGVSHPDALLTRRGGPVFATIDPSSAAAAGAYRNAPIRAIAVETARDRRERSRVRRANRIELCARFALAILMATDAVILLAGLQVN